MCEAGAWETQQDETEEELYRNNEIHPILSGEGLDGMDSDDMLSWLICRAGKYAAILRCLRELLSIP